MKFDKEKVYWEPFPHAESRYVGELMRRELSSHQFPDVSHALEVGPKHGCHTAYVASAGPVDITLIELPSKKKLVDEWRGRIAAPTFPVYTDFLRYTTGKQFALLLCCGVLYHNFEQLRILKKLRSMATEGAVLVVESATNRTDHFRDESIIEVFWPDTYRGIGTTAFMMSKRAMLKLLDIAGWHAQVTSDDHPDLANADRLAAVCTTKAITQTYDASDVDHSYIDE